MKIIQIRIIQQNESCQLHNVYVGYNNKPYQLHSMALTLDQAKILAVNIIIANKEYKAEIDIHIF